MRFVKEVVLNQPIERVRVKSLREQSERNIDNFKAFIDAC